MVVPAAKHETVLSELADVQTLLLLERKRREEAERKAAEEAMTPI